MNWGKGIIIGLIAFMTFISVLVFKMFSTAEDGFDKDYYEKGLAFDKEYDLKQNVITDNAQPKVSQDDDFVNITFSKIDSGSVIFKRPSNQKQDVFFNVDQKEIQIPKSSLAKGEWKLQLKWTAENKNYLYETNLFMP